MELAWSPAIGAISYNVYGSTVAGLVPGAATLTQTLSPATSGTPAWSTARFIITS